MKKVFLAAIILAAAIAACMAMWWKNPVSADSNSRPAVKIGFNLPLSGDVAEFGRVMKGAAELAKEDLKDRRLKYDYELIFEDNAYETKTAALVDNKFIFVDKVDAIVDTASGIGLVTSPLAEKNKVIHISNSAIDSRVAEGKYNFIHWTRPEKEAQKMLEIIQSKGFSQVAVFTSVDQDTITLAEALGKELRKAGVGFTETMVNMGEKQVDMLLASAEERRPDLYVLLLYTPTIDLMLKKIAEKGIKTEVASIEYFNFMENIGLAEGRWFVDASELKPEFLGRFTRHNNSGNLFTAGNTYDAVMLLVEAFERAKTKEQAIDELIRIKEYDGAIGRLFQDDDGIFHSEPTVKIIRNSQPVLLKELKE